MTGVVRQLKTMSQALYWTITWPSACEFEMVHEPEKSGEALRFAMFTEFSTMLATAFESLADAAAGIITE